MVNLNLSIKSAFALFIYFQDAAYSKAMHVVTVAPL